jgi:peptide chain release factor 3
MTWPVGRGRGFVGVYSIPDKQLLLFRPHDTERTESIAITDLSDPRLDQLAGAEADRFREEVELAQEVYPSFSTEAYLAGSITPVFFGSALNNFGVQELLDCFVDIAPAPQEREADARVVRPEEETFSGLVFKIHANLDPKHRDRIAFMRVCSGVFERNKTYLHVRTRKSFKTSTPTAFMAQERTIIDAAYPGDIVGLHDTGALKIGDTLTDGEGFSFVGVPSFAPQIFKRVVNLEPIRSKQLNKGLEQLSEEGVVQLFTMQESRQKLIGVVGALQFDVLQYRLEHEYKASVRFESVDYSRAAWVYGDDPQDVRRFAEYHAPKIALDREGNYVFLALNQWMLERIMDDNPKIRFSMTSDYAHGVHTG